MSTSCGSPCYAAPELVMNQGMYVGSAVDIWSCGVILFAMLCGYLPYDDDPENPESDNINLLYKYILNTPLTFPDYISDEACDLMSLMLVPDPTKRCGMDAIIHHPWLSAHKHLFEEKKPSRRYQQEDAVVPPDTPEPNTNRRNTIATTYTQPVKSNDTPSSSIKEQEEEEEEEKEDDMEQDQTVPDDATMNDIPQPVTTQKDALLDSIPEKSPAEKKKQQDEQHSKVPQLHTPRSRHMSLVPPESNSILQDKFISSIKPSSTASTTLLQPPQQSPVKPNFSISTPYPASKPQQNNKRNSHHNARLLNDQPPPVTDRGTRRKTLSLLVNSMTDNKMPFARRQSRTPPQPQQQSNVNVMSSVSEHTATLFPSDKDKHKSTGKKFMDWFKKKPNGKKGK